MTDRERALSAEARISEMEEELATWRRLDQGAANREQDVMRVARVSARIRALTGTTHARGAAILLLHLLGRTERLCTHHELFNVLEPGRDTMPDVVKVRICSLRKALRAADMPDAILTVWGQGYVLSAVSAPRIRQIFDISDGGQGWARAARAPL
jgi:DNA-binding response OmpR family regulator